LRLVAWNANYNIQRRSLDDTLSLIEHLGADLCVVSETGPATQELHSAVWYVGDIPGLAVVAGDRLTLQPVAENDGAPPRMLGFRVRGSCEFDLLAAWPVSRKGDPSYHEVLMSALDRYSGLLGADRAIMAGDLNSSSRVTAQQLSHPRFVSAMSDLGMRSVYHAASDEPHGQESVPTYRHSSGPQRDFHLDYCFVSTGLLEAASLEILCDPYWMTVSDHYPLVLDVPDAAVAGPL
jgi:exodeoxyribonuclease-3